MNEYSTCKVCATDYLTEDMIEDIEGALYCLIDSGDICLVCGKYGHDCEKILWYKKEYVCTGCDAFYTITTKSDELRDQNCLECNRMLTLISSNEVADGAE